MKGLLLKDWYELKSTLIFLLFYPLTSIIIIVAGLDLFEFKTYSCIHWVSAALISTLLLNGEEASGWRQYSAALPYSRAMIVAEKYLIVVFSEIGMLIVTLAAFGIKMLFSGHFDFDEMVLLVLVMLSGSNFVVAFAFPYAFKVGTKRGAIATSVTFICTTFIMSIASVVIDETRVIPAFLVIATASIAAYFFSWYASIRNFQQRDIP